jgi:hypothetical protein
MREKLKQSFREIVFWLLNERNFFHVIIFYNLHFWLLSLWWLLHPSVFNVVKAVPLFNTLIFLALTPFLPLILTSFPKFRFLGENYRYLEYFQWVVWLLLYMASSNLFYSSVLISGLISIGLVLEAMKNAGSWQEEYLRTEPFFEQLRRLYAGKNIFPLGGKYYETLFRGRVNILLWPGNMRPDAVPYDELEELFHYYPYPKEGHGYLKVLRKYSVELVMLHDSVVSILGNKPFEGLSEIRMPLCQLRLFSLNRHEI